MPTIPTEAPDGFEKIELLFATAATENLLLAIMLCKQLPSTYHQQWNSLLDHMGTTYRALEEKKESDPTSFDLYQSSVIEVVRWLLPNFKRQQKAFHLAGFFGEYLSSEELVEEAAHPCFILETYLEEELSAADFAVLQMKKGTLKGLQQGTAFIISQIPATVAQSGLLLLQVWTKVYCQSTKNQQLTKEESREWQALAVQVLQHLKEILEILVNTSDEGVALLTASLGTLFHTSSLTLPQQLQEKELLAIIIELMSSTFFSRQQRQEVLLAHILFQVPLEQEAEMSWRSMTASNLYHGVSGADIHIYAQDFWQYQELLEFSTLSELDQLAYQKAIADLWVYYYVGALEPYLLFLQQVFPKNAANYFYLGQLYHGTLNVPDKALAYFKRYLSFEQEALPANNYILTERIYDRRCYAPSAPEALRWIGDIYENKGEEDKAIFTYQRAIIDYPDYHLSPYIPLIKLLSKQNKYSLQAYQLLVEYYPIFYKKTSWKDTLSTNYYSFSDLITGEESHVWMAKYEHLVGQDIDVQRSVGHKNLIFTFRYAFFYFAEWFFYEQLDVDKAIEALSLCNDCENQLYGERFVDQWTFWTTPKVVKKEAVLYLQADIILEQTQDYWQARALYDKILKIDPEHSLAKKGLQHIRQKLGY